MRDTNVTRHIDRNTRVMRATRGMWVARAAGVLACAGSLLGLPGASIVQAQPMTISVVRGSEAGPASGSNVISKRSVEKYAQAVAMSDDQKAAALALHEGYEADTTDARKTFMGVMSEAQRAAQDNDDHSMFMEKVPKARKEYTDKLVELEKRYFSDVKMLLTPDQEPNWVKVERIRRRETQLRGMMSGESVDLIEVVKGLKPEPAVLTTLNEPLGEYEIDLDRALQAKETIPEPEFKPGEFDMTKMQEAAAKQREAGTRVKEVNERHARRIKELLPDALRDKFDEAVKKETFPRIYRPSRVSKMMESATKLGDLTADQKQQIQDLRTQYDRDVTPINDRWASATSEAEKKGDDNAMPLGGGGFIRFGGPDEKDDSPVGQARKARTELDGRMHKRLESILSKEQFEKLPKEQPGEGQMMMEGTTIKAIGPAPK
jgi:hypothetical protein